MTCTLCGERHPGECDYPWPKTADAALAVVGENGDETPYVEWLTTRREP